MRQKPSTPEWLRLIAMAGAFLAMAGASQAASIEIRTFTGAGSLGTDSTVEVYLLEGRYHHRLVGSAECYTTAGLFPARDPLGVALSDVLQADLSVGKRSYGTTVTNPAGTVTISRAGWANLQVGTGPECEWVYTITGSFLPRRDEPLAPPQRGLWWVPVTGAAAAALALLAFRRRSLPQGEEETQGPIRIVEP